MWSLYSNEIARRCGILPTSVVHVVLKGLGISRVTQQISQVLQKGLQELSKINLYPNINLGPNIETFIYYDILEYNMI